MYSTVVHLPPYDSPMNSPPPSPFSQSQNQAQNQQRNPYNLPTPIYNYHQSVFDTTQEAMAGLLGNLTNTVDKTLTGGEEAKGQ